MSSSVLLELIGQTVPPAPYTGADKCTSRTRIKNIQLGDGDGKYQRQFCLDPVTAIVGISSTVSVDLQTAEDVYGDALAADDVAGLQIYNDGPGDIELRPSGVNGWVGLLTGTTPAILIPAGMTIALWSNVDGALPVSGASKSIDLVETGGVATATVTFHVMIRHP